MKMKWRMVSLIMVLLLAFSGCGKDTASGENENSDSGDTSSEAASSDVSFAENDEEMFTDRDYKADYDESEAIKIQLNGDSVTCDSDAVAVSGTQITIKEEATYLISGSLDDGMIIVDAQDTAKLQIVLNGVSVTSKTSAPLYILEADKVVVTLAEGSENTLSNGGSFTAIDENNIDAAIFSKQDITFNGEGSLTVSSPAGHGIVSKDDLVFTGGNYTVNSASHALDANDSIRIVNSSIQADAGKDGIHSENTEDTSLGFVYISSGDFVIDAEGDGISAEAYLQINDGTFNITSGGGSENGTKSSSDFYGGFMGGRPNEDQSFTDSETTEDSTSMKAMKSTGGLQISGGNFTIDSADDAVHANGSITVIDGEFHIATGDDGFHADETLTVSGGTIEITESYEGLEALDVEISGGDISLTASDDGLNAAGGTDSSGTGGRGDDQFGRPGSGGGKGGMGEPGNMGEAGNMGQPGGMGGSSSSDGSIVISGGTLKIKASGDGLDANGTLEITGGYTTVCGPTQGDTATLDYDVSGTISGGTFIGTGANGMAQTFSDSEQGVIAISVGNQSSGTAITVKNASGETVLSAEPELEFAVVILSSPDIKKGESYTVSVGSNSDEIEAN